MIFYPLPALVTPLPGKALNINDNDNNGRIPSSCLLPALMTPFPVKFFAVKYFESRNLPSWPFPVILTTLSVIPLPLKKSKFLPMHQP